MMNQGIMQAINKLKAIRNPQQAAMQSLQNDARQGNQKTTNTFIPCFPKWKNWKRKSTRNLRLRLMQEQKLVKISPSLV